jgi:hypothetical protein
MNAHRLLPAGLALVLGAALACSDSAGSGDVTLADLAGTWNATQFTLTNPANSSQSLDLITMGGSFTLTINASGAFSGEQSLLGNTDTFSGTVQLIDNHSMVLIDGTNPSDRTDLTYTLTGDRLAVSSSDLTYDWNNDGTDEAASLSAVLQRQ